jgi:formate dehydrogenase subunit delta
MSNDAVGGKDAAGAEHGSEGHGGAAHLVKMANDIGHFFGAEPEREDAVAGIANHIAKFWTKRMRDKLTAHVKRDGDAGLDDLPREALRRLAAQQAAVQQGTAQQDIVQPATAKQAAH